MVGKYFFITPAVLLLIAVPVQAAETFTDDFNTPHNYLLDGVIGTGWDGFLGTGENETVDVLDANITNVNSPNALVTSGALFIQSTGSNWHYCNPRGPLLYKIASGDFIAEVEVVDIACCFGSAYAAHNDSAIMARVPNLADAGPGEDYVSMNYFPAWCAHIGRSINDGIITNFGCSGDTCNDERYLQLERSGNTFYLRKSSDGITWTYLANDKETGTLVRDDMAGLALQVGLMHSMYSIETGYVSFDNFKLTADAFPSQPYATSPVPFDGTTEVGVDTNLRWKGGDYVQDIDGHELYISTDFNDVNDSNSAVKVVLTGANYVPPGGKLAAGMTYYWAVDEVNDACSPHKWEGEVWIFTTDGKATNPDPYDEEDNIPVEIAELKWTQSPIAVTQNFYFSEDEDEDEVAQSSTPTISNIPNDVNSVDMSEIQLSLCKTYYWRIESVCGELCTLKGDVWRFTVQDYNPIDNFESYSDTGKLHPPPTGSLKKVWIDGNYGWTLPPFSHSSGSLVQLNIDTHDGNPLYAHHVPDDNDIAQSGSQSLKFYYDNDGTVTWETDLYDCYPPEVCNYIPFPDTYLSEVYAAIDDAAQAEPELDSLDLKRDWSGYKVLKLSFYGDPNNEVEPMYAGLEDGSGNLAVIYHPDSNCIINDLWQDWHIELQDFADINDVNLTDIAKIYLGFGNKYNPQAGGTGFIFVDDIQLLAHSVCAPEYGEPAGDINGDCMVNSIDFAVLANEWLESSCLKADLYEDGRVDLRDLDILLGDWLKEKLVGD